MKRYAVLFRPLAEADLDGLYNTIAEASGAAVADRYTERIAAFCAGLETFPKRGHLRSDLGNGIRVIGFERRVAIVFHVSGKAVEIVRIFYGGRDYSNLEQID